MVKAPRSKDLAAALSLLGVEATYAKSPKGSWVVSLLNGKAFLLPLEGGKFKAAVKGSKEVTELSGPAVISWIAQITQ